MRTGLKINTLQRPTFIDTHKHTQDVRDMRALFLISAGCVCFTTLSSALRSFPPIEEDHCCYFAVNLNIVHPWKD